MSDKLKPCPFCGGEAELCIHDESIYCNDCDGGVTNYTSSKQELIDSWNKRVNNNITLSNKDFDNMIDKCKEGDK